MRKRRSRTASVSIVESSSAAYVSRTRAGYEMFPTSPAATRRNSPRVKCFSTSFCIAALISTPGGSKNWIRITSGSFGLTPTWNPALCASDFTRCRATAAGLTRRSATWTPVDETPEIIARLIIRHAAAPSRLATTRAPLQRGTERGGEPDCDIRRQIDVHHPRHPGLAEDARRAARLPDQALVQRRAGLDLLERIDPDAGQDHAFGADCDLVADRGSLVHAHVRAQVAAATDDRSHDVGAAADVGGRVDDRADDAAALADGHARREHRVRADVRAARDAAVIAEVRRPLDRLQIVEVHPVPQPDVAADPDPFDLELHALVERVEVRLPVLVEVAYVLPIAVIEDVPVDRPAHLEQQREQLLREVVRPVLGDVLQHFRLEHVDAGVDRVREDLAPGRLLEEALDTAVLVGDDDAELERVLDRLEPDRHRCPPVAVSLDEPREIDVAEGVSGDDEERVVEPPRGTLHGASGAERRLLHRVADIDAERLTAAEVAADRLRQKRDSHDHVLEAMALEELDDVLHARLADDRHHRLGLVRGQGPQTRALSTGHDDGLHRRSSLRAVRM